MTPGKPAPHAPAPPAPVDRLRALDGASSPARHSDRPAPMVAGDDLAFRYDGGPVVLEVDDLALAPGSLTVLLGPNGSGKSTLVAAIAGLHPPERGDLTVGDQPADRARRQVAAVWQDTAVNRGLPLTVADTVAMGRWPHRGLTGRLRRADRAAMDAALERLDIADLAGRQLAELSGGQRRRALVAQALATEAPVLLLDEPTAGLDRTSRDRILDAAASERARGVTVVMSTHDLDDLAVADHALLLAGRVVAAGPPAAVATDANLAAAYGPRPQR